MLLVPNYLSQQPQYPALLNWGHPLLEKAEFVLLGSQPFYNPTNKSITRTGSQAPTPTYKGLSPQFSSSVYQSYPLPTATGGTGPWTVACLIMPVSGWSTFGENVVGVCEAPGSDIFDRGIQRQPGTTDWAAYLYDGGLKKAGSTVVPAVGRMDCVIATTDASTLICAANGIEGLIGVANGGHNSYASAVFCVGHASSSTGSAVTQFPLVIRTTKYWPPALRKMFADNPWQIFQSPPIDIWVPSAGGGVTIDCTTGNAVAAGISCAVTQDITIACAVGNAVTDGVTASLPVTITASVGNAVAAGATASVTQAVTINTTLGNAVAAGVTAIIELGTGITINASVGNAVAAGIAAAILQDVAVSCGVGNAVAAGVAASIALGGGPLILAGSMRHAATLSSSARLATTLRGSIAHV